MNFKPILWTSDAKSDGSTPIKIRITEGKKTKYHNLKLYVHPIDWNSKKCRVLERRANADKINAEIVKCLRLFESIHLENRLLSVDIVMDLFKGGKTKEGLLDFIDNFIDRCDTGKIKRTDGTVRAYRVTYNNLIKFRNEGNLVDFQHIGHEFYLKWTAFMREEIKDVKIAFKESTIGKEIKHLKVFLNHALEMGLTKSIEHKKEAFKVVNEESDTIYLTEEETDRLIALEVPEHLQAEKDRYIVAYYLLLRFSDSMNIQKSKIVSNTKGHFIRTKILKTGQNLVVPIKPLVWDILNKYNFTFPDTTNQEANRKLKLLGQLASLDDYLTTCSTIGGKRVEKTIQKWQLLTTHTARRSGATNLYKAKVPTKVIMDIGGWKTEASFMRYIRVNGEENAEMASGYDFFK